MVTHPSYQIFPHSRCSSPFPHSEPFSLSLYLALPLPLTFLLCNSVTISLVFLSFSLYFSFGYPFHLFVGLSMCLYLSIFLFSPTTKVSVSPTFTHILSPSRSFSTSITRVSSILLPLPPFSFCLSLLPSHCAVSLLLRKKTIHCQYSRPRLSTMKPTFFHRGEFPLPAYIYVSFLSFFFFFFKGR